MHLKEQSYILTLERYRNFSKAADALGISQPAISTFLTNLEKSLDTQLFDRSAKPMVLTDAGKLYVETARKMMKLKDEFDLELAQLVKGHAARIHIGVQHIRAPHMVPSLTVAIHRTFPDLEVVFHENSGDILYKMLETGQVDLLLTNTRHPLADMEMIPLMEERLLFAVPENHPLAERFRVVDGPYPWIDLSLFQEETFLLPPPSHSTRYYTDRLFQALGWFPERVNIYSQTETAFQMISAGCGVGFVLESYLSYFQLGRLPKLFVVGRPPVAAHFSVIYPRERYQSLWFRNLLEMLTFVFSGEFKKKI